MNRLGSGRRSMSVVAASNVGLAIAVSEKSSIRSIGWTNHHRGAQRRQWRGHACGGGVVTPPRAGRGDRRSRAVWAAAGALALLTIAGFLWSRTLGFPQMADHIGQWDELGLASVAFEAVIVLISASVLGAARAEAAEMTLTQAHA